jgi:putative transposase
MTKRRFPAQQIAFAPRQASAGAGSEDSANGGRTHENWRETHGALTPCDIERWKQLEEDYRQLKQVVAGLGLD